MTVSTIALKTSMKPWVRGVVYSIAYDVGRFVTLRVDQLLNSGELSCNAFFSTRIPEYLLRTKSKKGVDYRSYHLFRKRKKND
jgi:hypothetical protein